MENTRSGSPRPSQGLCKTRMQSKNNQATTVLQIDASIIGLGACLLPDKKPVYFASKALTEAQQGYVAIELESLAVAWTMENFHHFLYGNHFLLETDQKPLEVFPINKLESGYTQIAKDTHQNIPLQFQCALPTRLKEPASQLIVQSRGTARFY